MSPDLTPAADRALASARRWARHAGATDIEPGHLLLALIEEEEGRVAEILSAHGVGLGDLRALLAPGLSLLPPLVETDGQPHDPSLMSVIYAARDWARELTGATTVASEHLLIALLHQEGRLGERLRPLGLDAERLVESLREAPAPPLTLDEPLELTTPADVMGTARILDANANRSREALRVVEEYCRFQLNDAFLTGELKALRHELAATLADLPPALLLAARETRGDVGTQISTPSEGYRQSPRHVVEANLKRLQESLRALEEYGKLHSLRLGRAVEAMRYRSYTLEKAILTGADARMRLADLRLYVLLSASQCPASLEWTIAEAAAGGAQIFQLREKGLDDRSLLRRARDVRRWTRKAGVLFILNDRPDLAVLAEADGVHVGQEDLSVKDVRLIVGAEMLIGVSTHHLDQLRQAILDGASYVGLGPTFPSATKDFDTLAGLEFLRQAAAETSFPAFALGGVGATNIDQVLATGVKRVAVSHAVCTAEEPRLAAAALRRALDEAGHKPEEPQRTEGL